MVNNLLWLRGELASVDDELAGIQARFLALLDRMESFHAVSEQQSRKWRSELAASRRGIAPKPLPGSTTRA